MSAEIAAPFPWFGGKRRAAHMVWEALGDPGGYVEPFAGSAAVLLSRDLRGRRVETLNDADGWLVNAWRAMKLSPDDVAEHAFGPVTEIDYHARLAWLQERRGDDLVSWLEGDPEAHDAKAAGWWLYVLASGIGDPFGPGPWRVLGDRLVDARKLPHLGNAGRGVNRELPHLGNAGRGVNRGLPHLGDAGQDALIAYMRLLSNRLSRVRITCGDWKRVVTPAASRAKTGGDSVIGVFLDPPYSTSGDLYAEADADGSLSASSREWCETAGSDYRIVIAGYNDEHSALLDLGWVVKDGRSGGGAGYSKDGLSGRRERLWMSPNCNLGQGELFGEVAA